MITAKSVDGSEFITTNGKTVIRSSTGGKVVKVMFMEGQSSIMQGARVTVKRVGAGRVARRATRRRVASAAVKTGLSLIAVRKDPLYLRDVALGEEHIVAELVRGRISET
jgi:hypothetical protein